LEENFFENRSLEKFDHSDYSQTPINSRKRNRFPNNNKVNDSSLTNLEVPENCVTNLVTGGRLLKFSFAPRSGDDSSEVEE
jgi:hypothetical protein